MIWRIEVKDKPGTFDAVGESIKKDIEDLGIKKVKDVRFAQLYFIKGAITQDQVGRIAEQLLADNITQDYIISECAEKSDRPCEDKNSKIVEIAYNPGVMDPVEDSALKGIRDLGIHSVEALRTAKKFIIYGKLAPKEFSSISEKLLYNKLIQHIVLDNSSYVKSLEAHSDRPGFELINVDLLKASDRDLARISKQGQLFLSVDEMAEIQKYFRKQKRNPTDCELETIAQTWSEHCGHKTFRGNIEYKEKIPNSKSQIPNKSQISNSKYKTIKIKNLLKTTIMRVTKELDKPWCVSVFKDNSGVIRFDEENDVCFKVETHNHPSALEPFGGANTGIGGVIRDPLGTGMAAKPILNTDVFCFAPPDFPFSKVPKGVLHPKRVMKGVVSGVRDYGNKMGIPTINGAILFDEGFIGNPLVYCGTAGILPKNKSSKAALKGDLVVVVGGKTGRDGIHGATFSSGELTHESETISGGAVQIGNPIQEKKMLDTILQARDKNLYNAITDCGAGGLSSAVGEMGQELGAKVYLEKVPLKYSGLSYTEIWISESQERMVLAVSPEKIDDLLRVFNAENVEATVIGEFTDTKRLALYYKNNLVCDLDMQFLHEGIPQIERKAVFIQPKHKEPKFPCPKDLAKELSRLLSSLDICSKEWVIRQYDHEVQGGSVLKPLVGIVNDGPSDASIVKPIPNSQKALVVSNGINFRYGFIDPYWMAASCIDEALRQIIAVGGSLKRTAILDNFCWGNPNKPDRLGSLTRCAFGCYDSAVGFSVPFISGKDSLNNEYSVHGKSISIPGTLLISAMSVMDNVSNTVSMYFKNPGNLIYIIGETFDELGASAYFKLHDAIGNNVPKVNFKRANNIFDTMSRAADKKIIRAAHDCSEGGLAVALAEMAFSGGLGADIFLSEVPYEIKNQKSKIKNTNQNSKIKDLRNDFVLFSESNSRFIVEVAKKDQKEFEKLFNGLPIGLIGCVSKGKEFKMHGLDTKPCIKANIDELKESWQEPLRW